VKQEEWEENEFYDMVKRIEDEKTAFSIKVGVLGTNPVVRYRKITLIV
jgi:hypothetical protein